MTDSQVDKKQPSEQWRFWREARPMELEPYYCYWVSHLTSEGLHDKADIATVLAILHQQRDDMQEDALRLHREKMAFFDEKVRLQGLLSAAGREAVALRLAASHAAPVGRADFIQVNDTMDVAECCVHDQIQNPLEREETQEGLRVVRALALSMLRSTVAQGEHEHVWRKKWTSGEFIGQECACGAERDVPIAASSTAMKSYQHSGEAEFPPAVQEAIRKLLVDFGELPDRTSPEDFPEGYVLTREEIVGGILRVLCVACSASTRRDPLALVSELRSRANGETDCRDIDLMHQAAAAIQALGDAAREFVDKVDRGEARSRRSYAAFKAALAASESNAREKS